MALENRTMVLTMLVLAAMGGWSLCLANGTAFENVCSWAAFDPGDHGVGDDPDGYDGGVFDGRYVYFVPYSQGINSYHDEVLRFDTLGDFSDALSWTTFDPGEHGVGHANAGYLGGVSDGRYVYFSPWRLGSGYHGEVLRYDATGEFGEASSWAAYDPGAHGVGNDPDGYTGATFDGRYIYFAPAHNGNSFHGEVLRYDTAGTFTDTSSWATYDAGDHGVGSDPDGYMGSIFDGRYVYFVPNYSGTTHHGEVLRYDVTGEFSDASSWATYDPGLHGVGSDPDGFHGGAFDGRYVYFVPYHNGTSYYGEVLRFDTTGQFTDVAAWDAYDAGAHGVGDHADGYHGAVIDGRYVYFVPNYNNTGNHSEVLRLDTTGEFANVASWAAFDPGDHGVNEEAGGYHRGVFDGHFIYFVPAGWQPAHGEVLRYDTAAPAGDLDCDGCVDQADLGILLTDWGCTGGDCPGDCDNDGDTDHADLGILLAHWGEGCP